jgi:hypothetical protein
MSEPAQKNRKNEFRIKRMFACKVSWQRAEKGKNERTEVEYRYT